MTQVSTAIESLHNGQLTVSFLACEQALRLGVWVFVGGRGCGGRRCGGGGKGMRACSDVSQI